MAKKLPLSSEHTWFSSHGCREESYTCSPFSLQTLLSKQESYEESLKEAETNLLKIEALQARVEDLEKEVANVTVGTETTQEEEDGTPPAAATPSVSPSALQKELEEAKEAAERLPVVEAEKEDLEKRLATLEEELESLKTEKDEEEAKLKTQIGELEVSRVDLDARVEALTLELESHVTRLPEAGSRSASRLLAEVERLQVRRFAVFFAGEDSPANRFLFPAGRACGSCTASRAT